VVIATSRSSDPHLTTCRSRVLLVRYARDIAATDQTARRTQQQRREETRGRLIDATVRAIASDGYRAATTRRIVGFAGASLGALAHHFPTREELIAAALDEVGQRGITELRARATAIDPQAADRTRRLLDVLWEFFNGELFAVWLKVWLAAAEDSALHARLAPIERDLNTAIAAAITELAPAALPRKTWTRRVSVALNTMRGLALALNIEPRESPLKTDPWPATRRELTQLLDR
jgi:AcrR family transcriptional regulator